MRNPDLFPHKFKLGNVWATPRAMTLKMNFIPYLQRHVRADWGDDMDFGDIQANDDALVEGGPLVSRYRVTKSACIYVITDADRENTTILLPEEY